VKTQPLPDLPGDFPGVRTARPLGGGDVAGVWDVALMDGCRLVVKAAGTDPALEAEGLAALRAAGAPTPAVLALDDRVLVLEHVSGASDLPQLGRALARMHEATAERFGWHRDNVIGPLPQRNAWTADWPTFYVEQRLRPHLPVLPASIAARLTRAIEGPLPELLEHAARPSLVHGDLWSGNLVAGRWLIDPAVHYADREVDLAMLDLFGGVPEALQAGYDAVWPLGAGWAARRPALQLYPLLVHVRLFGAGYLRGVRARLDQLGW